MHKLHFTKWVITAQLILCLLLCSFAPVFAATSSSYQLQSATKHSTGSLSDSYTSCTQFDSVGVSGSSSSYQLMPALNCQPVAVEEEDEGDGRRRHYCGNAVVEDDEQCDDGNYVSGDGCSAACLIEGGGGGGGTGGGFICGNGQLEGTEQCDDANTSSGDGCSSACVIEYCGDGIVQSGLGEQCDDSNQNDADSCSNQCVTNPVPPQPPVPPTQPVCGNGLREPGEQCDDGNTNDQDGCTISCIRTRPELPTVPEQPEVPVVPPIPQPPTEPQPPVIPEFPDYGAGVLFSICGNNILEFSEACDDGNLIDGDGCSSRCVVEQPTLPEGTDVPTQPVLIPDQILDLGIDYITNDSTVFFFETFGTGTKTYQILIQNQEGDVLSSVSVNTSSGYFSLQLNEPLPDGYYLVTVRDADVPEKVRTLVLEVRAEEPIDAPFLTRLDGQEISDQDDLMPLVVFTDQPMFEGATSLPATIAVYSHELDQTFIVYTDDQDHFVFEYPSLLEPGMTDTLDFIALYENGRVSKETTVRIERPLLRGAAPRLMSSFDPLFWAFITLLTLLTTVFVLLVGRVFSRLTPTIRANLLLSLPGKSIVLRRLQGLLMLILIIALSVFFVLNAMAATTTPNLIPYEGILKDSGGTPVTTAQDFRFSFWLDGDFSAGVDRDGAGAIPGGAPGFSGYSEVQTITPDAAGFFQVNIGEVLGSIPDFIITTHLYLQVEVKPDASADTAYETLDIDGVDNATDRQAIGTLPYARNADFIDNAELGSSSGDIVTLGAGDVFPTTFIPGGTNSNDFLIDANDDAPGITRLSFGAILNNQILQFDPDGVGVGDGWFEFTDDVNISGNLTVTGTINGVTLGVTNQTVTLVPEYPNATVDGDGTNNKGKMQVFFVDTDGAGGPDNFNYYRWTTRQTSLQDFDVIVRFRLPDGFDSFQATPLVLRYRTFDGNVANNRIDVSVEDSTGTVVPGLAGNSALTSAGTFSTSNITFGGGTFTAGTEITVRITMSSLDTSFADVSDLQIQFVAD